MKNPCFNLLDVFPLTTSEHSSLEIAYADAGIEKLRGIEEFQNEDEIVKAIIDGEGLGEAKSAIEGALKSSKTYREWQDLMPFLKDVPNIHGFRTKPKRKNNVSLVDEEINKVGGLLPKGQVLYRGGCFDNKDIRVDNGPISTTTMPCVARWHALEVNGQFAILRISENHKVKAFSFKTRGNQRLKHEYEVLLQNNLQLKYVKSFSHGGLNVFEYEVYVA